MNCTTVNVWVVSNSRGLPQVYVLLSFEPLHYLNKWVYKTYCHLSRRARRMSFCFPVGLLRNSKFYKYFESKTVHCKNNDIFKCHLRESKDSPYQIIASLQEIMSEVYVTFFIYLKLESFILQWVNMFWKQVMFSDTVILCKIQTCYESKLIVQKNLIKRFLSVFGSYLKTIKKETMLHT